MYAISFFLFLHVHRCIIPCHSPEVEKIHKNLYKNTNIDLKESIKIILQTLELNIYIIKPLKGSKIHGSDLYVSRHKLLLTNLFSREIDMPYLSCKIQ